MTGLLEGHQMRRSRANIQNGQAGGGELHVRGGKHCTGVQVLCRLAFAADHFGGEIVAAEIYKLCPNDVQRGQDDMGH